MPSGLKRRESRFHYITVSCYRREPLFDDAAARDVFCRELERVRQEFEFVLVGFVVMPEHVHLLIGEPNRPNVSTVMQVLKQRVAKALLPEIGGECFWQKRFYDFNVFTEKKRIEKLRYIHRNPVKRGLVDRVTDWEWSSARHYWLGEDGVVKVAVPVRWLGSVPALHE